ncbi:MAG TPA: cystine ABC transporter substrate-binding protein, partial [Pseudomonas sp.]|nr:cystine ABC transporter substrate-binding protein [Pseudomonas sp.]
MTFAILRRHFLLGTLSLLLGSLFMPVFAADL